MKIFRDTASSTPSAVAIGVFDGLHRGHQKVLENLKEIASRHGVLSSVVTFDPHPAVALAPDRAPTQLATIEQRLEGLEALGIDQVRVLTFNAALAGETAESFIARVLVDEMKASHIVVGEDFRFGHDRQGNVAMLEFETQNLERDGIGSDWHPNLKTHQNMADRLIAAIKTDLGW